MDEERGSTGEKTEEISTDNVAFRDDFAQTLAWDAGQYHEEEDYLNLDLNE